MCQRLKCKVRFLLKPQFVWNQAQTIKRCGPTYLPFSISSSTIMLYLCKLSTPVRCCMSNAKPWATLSCMEVSGTQSHNNDSFNSFRNQITLEELKLRLIQKNILILNKTRNGENCLPYARYSSSIKIQFNGKLDHSNRCPIDNLVISIKCSLLAVQQKLWHVWNNFC